MKVRIAGVLVACGVFSMTFGMGCGKSDEVDPQSDDGRLSAPSDADAGEDEELVIQPPDGPQPEPRPKPCTELTTAEFVLDGVDDQITHSVRIVAKFLPQVVVEGEALGIGLFRPDDGERPEAPGRFELGVGVNENYATCTHCVELTAGLEDEEKFFFANGGWLTLDDTSGEDGRRVKGVIENLNLVESKLVGTDHIESQRVPGGRCLHVTRATFDVAVD